jgi:hypothetical protein
MAFNLRNKWGAKEVFVLNSHTDPEKSNRSIWGRILYDLRAGWEETIREMLA